MTGTTMSGVIGVALLASSTLLTIAADPSTTGPALDCSAGDINNGKAWIAATVDRLGPTGPSGRVSFRERGEILVVEDLRSNGHATVAVVRVCVGDTWQPPRQLDSGPAESQASTHQLTVAEGRRVRFSACERFTEPDGRPSYRNCGPTVEANA